MDVHNRDTINEMVKLEVGSINDFDWLSQLRYVESMCDFMVAFLKNIWILNKTQFSPCIYEIVDTIGTLMESLLSQVSCGIFCHYYYHY